MKKKAFRVFMEGMSFVFEADTVIREQANIWGTWNGVVPTETIFRDAAGVEVARFDTARMIGYALLEIQPEPEPAAVSSQVM